MLRRISQLSFIYTRRMLSKDISIGLIGAGMVGLSTALLIKRAIPEAAITIYSERFLQDTTSHGAAGAFRPCSDQYTHNALEDLHRWSKTSAEHYWQLQQSEEAVEAGCSMIPMYQVYRESTPPKPELYTEFVKALREVNQEELQATGFSSDIRSGHFCYTPVIEGRYYLPYLTRQLTYKFPVPARFIQKKISQGADVSALCENHDILVNCCGLGARELWDDKQMYPSRGQLVRVKAPWIKFGAYAPDNVYFYPCRDSLVVGGTRQRDDFDVRVRPEETAVIVENAARYQPTIRKADIAEVWAGLRPCRDGIRLETQWLSNSGKGHATPVIHNYGHAGFGISLGYGTAVDACKLALNALNELGFPATTSKL